MTELDDYLRGIYKDDKRQIQMLHEIIGEVMPVFYDFWDDTKKTWPYKVSETSIDPGKKDINYSTHSMILFTLEVASFPSDATALMPTPKQPPDLKPFNVALEKLRLFAIIWAESKSLHNRLISVFSGCVHFATQRPGVESV